MKKLIYLFTIAILFSCKKDQTPINGLDAESFEESVSIIKAELPSNQAHKIDEAIQLIYTYNTPNEDRELKWSRTRNLLNTKTADEVFDMAEKIAYRKNINWDRNSSGSLNEDDLHPNDIENNKENLGDESLKNATSFSLEYTNMDQNRDGVDDAIMVFVKIMDGNKKAILYENAEINADFQLLNNQNLVLNKRLKISDSNVGNVNLRRGVILAYHAFNSEMIDSDLFNLKVDLVTPYGKLSSNLDGLKIPYKEYLERNKEELERAEAEKESAVQTVENFVEYINAGDLKSAHDLSVNPQWKDYKLFSSKKFGFGAVKSASLEELKIISFDPVKERSAIQVKIVASYKSDSALEMNKILQLQKVGEHWKIVNSKNSN